MHARNPAPIDSGDDGVTRVWLGDQRAVYGIMGGKDGGTSAAGRPAGQRPSFSRSSCVLEIQAALQLQERD